VRLSPNDYVSLYADAGCIADFSACPQDVVPVNGLALTPAAAHFEVQG
jgi:uncharacterized protein